MGKSRTPVAPKASKVSKASKAPKSSKPSKKIEVKPVPKPKKSSAKKQTHQGDGFSDIEDEDERLYNAYDQGDNGKEVNATQEFEESDQITFSVTYKMGAVFHEDIEFGGQRGQYLIQKGKSAINPTKTLDTKELTWTPHMMGNVEGDDEEMSDLTFLDLIYMNSSKLFRSLKFPFDILLETDHEINLTDGIDGPAKWRSLCQKLNRDIFTVTNGEHVTIIAVSANIKKIASQHGGSVNSWEEILKSSIQQAAARQWTTFSVSLLNSRTRHYHICYCDIVRLKELVLMIREQSTNWSADRKQFIDACSAANDDIIREGDEAEYVRRRKLLTTESKILSLMESE